MQDPAEVLFLQGCFFLKRYILRLYFKSHYSCLSHSDQQSDCYGTYAESGVHYVYLPLSGCTHLQISEF